MNTERLRVVFIAKLALEHTKLAKLALELNLEHK